MATNVALTGLARDMQQRADEGRPIRIGLIGSGEMGTDIVTRVAHMPGIEVGAIAELNVPNALKAVDIAYREQGRGREVGTAASLHEAMEGGVVAVTDRAELVLESGLIDVVIDATGVPAVDSAGLRFWSAGGFRRTGRSGARRIVWVLPIRLVPEMSHLPVWS